MCPSNKDLANVIENNVNSNNGCMRRDLINAKKIFGPDVKYVIVYTVYVLYKLITWAIAHFSTLNILLLLPMLWLFPFLVNLARFY